MQCTISYDEESNFWYIVDSDGVKTTLNGTWYLADDFNVITSKMNLRAGTTTFEANFEDA